MPFMLLMIPKGYETTAPGAMPDAEAAAGFSDLQAQSNQRNGS